MADSQTGTHWSHLLGEAMQGPLQGTRLETLPAVMTDWESWRRDHPQTTVLNMSRTAREYQRDFYADPSRFVLGIAAGNEARAWSFTDLMARPVVNDQFRELPILLSFDATTGGGYSYDRRLDEQTLEFEQRDGQLVDQQTESLWDAATGRATSGPLDGRRLRPVVTIISYRRAWVDFHPKSTFWQPK